MHIKIYLNVNFNTIKSHIDFSLLRYIKYLSNYSLSVKRLRKLTYDFFDFDFLF